MRMIGIDVGGTFTDAVFHDDTTGELRWTKAPSTPAAPADGVMAAIERDGTSADAIDRFVHGVTIGTNAILERRGAPVWLITTRGFRDVLEIARTNRTVLYDIRTLKPEPLAPRTRVFEVEERVMADGTVLAPLDPAAIHAIAARLRNEPPAALVVGFLHSYQHPQHEDTATRILREALPGWFVCGSAEVLPELREYERFNTAAINAYIGPLTARYLHDLRGQLRGRGYRHAVYLMTSSGGIETAERAARFPVHTVLSGPAGGVAATIELGERLGMRNLITCDMGGTSTDVCLIEDLAAPVTSEQTIAGLPIRTPQIEINSVGAGGGSIAWIDDGPILRVGPRSAGAHPGPACYGRGGTEPTVTDANLVMGRLAPSLRLAGMVALDAGLATQAVDRIGTRFPGLDTASAAEGIVRIAVARMVSAIKEISVARGHDPRDFALLAFGGAGPMHATAIADELEITRVVVPQGPGNFCALGALISDVRHDHLRSHHFELATTGPAELERAFAAIEDQAHCEMLDEGIVPTDIRMERSAGMRYAGQSWNLPVRLPERVPAIDALAQLFHAAHERRFGYATADPVQIVNLRVAAVGRVAKPRAGRWQAEGSIAAATREVRQARFDGAWLATPVLSRDRLPAGARLDGPAIVEEMGAVTVVPPTWRLEVGTQGELHLHRRPA